MPGDAGLGHQAGPMRAEVVDAAMGAVGDGREILPGEQGVGKRSRHGSVRTPAASVVAAGCHRLPGRRSRPGPSAAAACATANWRATGPASPPAPAGRRLLRAYPRNQGPYPALAGRSPPGRHGDHHPDRRRDGPGKAQKDLRLPSQLEPGIEGSDDPLIDAWVRAYVISFGRRLQ